MLTIDIDLLTGRYIASQFNDRQLAEWPPHPARVYSALVAVWAEDQLGDLVAAALDWLADAGPPEIFAAPASTRSMPVTYVPGVGTSLLGRTYDAANDIERAQAALDAAGQEGDARVVASARRRLGVAARKFRQTLARESGAAATFNSSALQAALDLMPAHRNRQPRSFPSVTPAMPLVSMVWRAEPTDAVANGLGLALGRVHRLGHSTSLVACSVRIGEPNGDDRRIRWRPSDEGEFMLRVVSAGQRQRLMAAFNEHHGVDPRILPYRDQRYTTGLLVAPAQLPTTVFGNNWIVFREVGTRLGLRLTRAPDIARALRNTLMAHADDPPPTLITGHALDGRPLQSPHAAYVSLADVRHPHSSGIVLGAAIVLPRVYQDREYHGLLRAIGRWESQQADGPLKLLLGRDGVLNVERVRDDESRSTLRAPTWSGPHVHWATVTPVALDQNPGNLYSHNSTITERAAENARAIIARACEYVGLPRPAQVEIHYRSVFAAVPGSRQFMPFPKKEGTLRRVCVHAELVFDAPVEGPLLLGVGRYQGMGLLLPVSRRTHE